MIFSAFVVAYCIRANLSIALVGMVNQQRNENKMNSSIVSCPNLLSPRLNNSFSSANDLEINGEFDWSSQTQGCILGSFYIGYLFTQIPGGIIAAKYGGKWVIGIGVFIASLLSLFIPIAAWNGELWLIAVRGLQGMAEVMPISVKVN